MFWTIFKAITFVDIGAVVLMVGYASYEYLWAWMHDEKVEPRLVYKTFNFELSDKDRAEYNKIPFSLCMFIIIFSAALVLGVAITWPVSLPILMALGAAFYIRENIRKDKEDKQDV